jgi:DnaK suppressor protein
MVKKALVNKIKKQLLEQKQAYERAVNKGIVVDQENNSFADANDLATHDTDLSNEMTVKNIKNIKYQKILDTLSRIDSEDFGVCDECGLEISDRRLEAYPTSSLCVSCQEEFEKAQKTNSLLTNLKPSRDSE